jgi:hypothetical protein
MIALRPPDRLKIWERLLVTSHGQASSTTFSGCQQPKSIRVEAVQPTTQNPPVGFDGHYCYRRLRAAIESHPGSWFGVLKRAMAVPLKLTAHDDGGRRAEDLGYPSHPHTPQRFAQ